MADRGDFPRPLADVHGPFDRRKLDGAAEGMGDHGPATRALHAQGLVPPDLICGMTLALISDQPRFRDPARRPAGKVSGTDGGVWVRERFTVHRPLAADDAWTVSGESSGVYVRKGRRYSTTVARSVDSAGHTFASNVSTGLTSYRPDPDLPDGERGIPLAETPMPTPDSVAAAGNPHIATLGALQVGDRLGGHSVVVTLAMMAARDTKNPNNPIHSDPEAAKRAGLRRPIAGGSHVLAFALEPVMAAVGTEAFLHGSTIDVRWKAPTEDGVAIVPTATVVAAESDAVTFELRVELRGGAVAMIGEAIVPLPS